MPIYAPSLPPHPDLSRGQNPVWVLMRFEFRRMLRNKIGLFFLFGFGVTLLIQVGMLYFRFLINTKASWGAFKEFSGNFLSQGAEYQADHLSKALLLFLWFLMAVVGGGLISRDSLFRTRPLIYAHPVSQVGYLLAKTGFAWGVAMGVMMPFILLPWLLSLVIAGVQGPVWPTLPLRLVPAAALVALMMSSVVVGVSSLASTPRTGTSWIIGVFLGTTALGTLIQGMLGWPNVISLQTVSQAWSALCCGMVRTDLTWLEATLATLGHSALWLSLAWTRTRPSEAIL